ETLSPAEAAKRLGVDRSTISRKIKAGDIATIKVGSHHRIARREFERYRDSLVSEALFTCREFAATIAGWASTEPGSARVCATSCRQCPTTTPVVSG
ncbi:MAG: helix-turn-helix domain-containing protein, partial [Phycisphaerales bacterium]